MLPQEYLGETIKELRKLKDLADEAVEQISDGDFFATLDPESNSIALIVKHMAGNMRSRWRAFRLTPTRDVSLRSSRAFGSLCGAHPARGSEWPGQRVSRSACCQ